MKVLHFCVHTLPARSSKFQRTELRQELGCLVMIRCRKAITGRKSPRAGLKYTLGVEKVQLEWPERCGGAHRCEGGGTTTLWLMIKPGGHSAGAKRVKLHPLEVGVMTSGIWRSLFLYCA